jgi:hypothetical protein
LLVLVIKKILNERNLGLTEKEFIVLSLKNNGLTEKSILHNQKPREVKREEGDELCVIRRHASLAVHASMVIS